MVIAMIKYIESGDKRACYGCSACAIACARGAISLCPDKEGFLYPVLDSARCVDCGACEKVCPIGKENPIRREQEAFAVQAKNRDVLDASASGAAFSLIAKQALDRGAWVCGCVFSDDWKATHVVTRDERVFRKMLGSKYVQSDMSDCFREIRRLLKEGQEVVFSGTPCQVAGLNAFLGSKYDSLLTIDLICHGVPSQKLLDDYLDSQGGLSAIGELSFRDKKLNGWCSNGSIVRKVRGKRLVSRTSPYNDTYYNLFYLANSVSRETCYECVYSSQSRVSDLTIGDYWNADSAGLDFEFQLGTSIVLSNSSKGREAVESIASEAYIQATDIAHAVLGNGNLSKPCNRPPERDEVYAAISDNGYSAAVSRFCKLRPWIPVMKRIIPKSLKKYLKRIKNGR